MFGLDINLSLSWLSWAGQPLWLQLISGILAFAGATHALLHKRHSASALGWMVVCLTLPLVGVLIYRLLGVNRVRRRAQKLRRDWPAPATPPAWRGRVPSQFERLAELGRRVSGASLSAGNQVTVLVGGEQAYPRMLDAIDSAQQRIGLATYIFESDQTGQQFVERLAAAKDRNVTVGVLVDGIGERYSRPRISSVLAKVSVACLRFLPPRLLPPAFYLNLRNHRKLLCIDADVAYSGGMNIGDRHLLSSDNPTRDIHFELRGPVVRQLHDCFDADWQFAGGTASGTGARSGNTAPVSGQPTVETTAAAAKTPGGERPVATDGSLCRVVPDGPDDDLDQLQTLILGAIGAARHRIAIVTPYFVPDSEFIAGLASAALAGVRVDIVLPARSNLRYVDWASRSLWDALLRRGVRIHLQPPPFDHSKLLVIDDAYSLITTANMDARSLRLNFELGVEVYSEQLAVELTRHIDELIAAAHPASLTMLEQRSLLTRLRDRSAWLLAPYL